MTNQTHMNLTDMEIDEASLATVCGGFGWQFKARGHSELGLGKRGNAQFNIDVDIEVTVIKINGNQNIIGGQDVTVGR